MRWPERESLQTQGFWSMLPEYWSQGVSPQPCHIHRLQIPKSYFMWTGALAQKVT